MRTTLTIDDDVLAAARSLALAENRSIGEVISELARRGLRPAPRERSRADVPIFDVPLDATPLTLEMVKRAEEGEG